MMTKCNKNANLSLDFIAGLIVGEGCFTWFKQKNGAECASFQLKMHVRDVELLKQVRDSLQLTEPVYTYNFSDGRKVAILQVRSRYTIENCIIPSLSGRLSGYKLEQFNIWKKRFFENKKTWRISPRIHLKDALKALNIPFYQE